MLLLELARIKKYSVAGVASQSYFGYNFKVLTHCLEIKTESAKSITESVESEIQERVSYSDSFDTLTSDELTSSTTSSSAQESKHLESAAVQTDPVEISNRLMEEKRKWVHAIAYGAAV